jgi:hypothetical protein
MNKGVSFGFAVVFVAVPVVVEAAVNVADVPVEAEFNAENKLIARRKLLSASLAAET